MKTGDVVTIRDGSYLVELTKNGFDKHTNPQYHTPKMQWEVVETNLTLPGETFLGNVELNDTIIRSIPRPERICFVRARYLRLLPTKCPTCNRTME